MCRKYGLLIAVVVGFACMGLAAPPSASVPANVTVQQEPLASSVLPPAIADFMVRTGRDGPVPAATAEKIWRFYAGQASIDPELLLEVLDPDDYWRAPPPLLVIASPVESPGEPLLLAVTRVYLQDGTEVPSGEQLFVGDIVTQGLVINAGPAPVLIESDNGERTEIGEADSWLAVCRNCSVGCSSGHYSCCTADKNGCCVCGCVPNGTGANCTHAGGPGSSTCSCGDIDYLP